MNHYEFNRRESELLKLLAQDLIHEFGYLDDARAEFRRLGILEKREYKEVKKNWLVRVRTLLERKKREQGNKWIIP